MNIKQPAKHPEPTLQELKVLCANAFPLLKGTAQAGAAAAPQAAPSGFSLLSDEQRAAFLAAVGQSIDEAPQLATPTSAAPITTKTAMSPTPNDAKSAWVEGQRRKLQGFQLSRF